MLGKRRLQTEEDLDVDMVPVMNMFLVLIPFLLISANFIHLRVINTSVPVQAESSENLSREKEVKVTVIAEIKEKGIDLSVISDEVESADLDKWKVQINKKSDDEYPLTEVADYLKNIKMAYPASDTMLVIPAETVIYDSIIQVMDAGRHGEDKSPLFPSVVLSGKV